MVSYYSHRQIFIKGKFDTGFTDWLAINTQDALSLGWELVDVEETRVTVQGEAQFDIYAGTFSLDTE